jgi:hypothetical protein
LLNSVTSEGPLNRAHIYKAAVVATARPDATSTTATRSRRAGRDRCFDDGSSRGHLTSTNAEAATASEVRNSGAEAFVPKHELPGAALDRLLGPRPS